MTWSERSLHAWLLANCAPPPGTAAGAPGSDAVVLTRPLDRPVACADQVVEGRHFEPDVPGRSIGAKAACRALSDLAATAATPRALLCTLRAAPTEEEARLRAILAGVRDAGAEFGAPLVGGDVSAGDGPLGVAVTALGAFEFEGRPPGREQARPGDAVLLTGPVGGSLLGRHLAIRPRLEWGRRLFAAGARAMIDVSDGLALDLSRIARRSGVSVRLELSAVPVHEDARRRAEQSGRSALEHALTDGEDHELVACLSPGDAEAARTALPALHAIGHVEEGEGLWVRSAPDEAWQPWSGRAGYVHGEDES